MEIPKCLPAPGAAFNTQSRADFLANWAAQGPAGYLVTTFGNQIVSAELASGFTVVRSDEGDEFALGAGDVDGRNRVREPCDGVGREPGDH